MYILYFCRVEYFALTFTSTKMRRDCKPRQQRARIAVYPKAQGGKDRCKVNKSTKGPID